MLVQVGDQVAPYRLALSCCLPSSSKLPSKLAAKVASDTRPMVTLREALEREWEHLVASEEAARALDHWQRIDPRLAGAGSVAGLVAAANRPGQPEESNAILAGLLELSGQDPLARRCLLQALLPVLVSLAGRYPSAGETPDERLQQVLALALERIRDLCGTGERWPAVSVANFVRDRLRRAEASARRTQRVPFDETRHLPASAPTASERLASVIVDGLRRGVLRQGEAAIVYTTRVAGVPCRALAAAQGLDPALVRTRRLRAERQLADAALVVC